MGFKIPQNIIEILNELAVAGFEAYLVGGCVRDLLLSSYAKATKDKGREPKDWDITTNATPDEIQKVFPDSVYENDFGTVGVKIKHQITSHKNQTNHKPQTTKSEEGKDLKLIHSKLSQNLPAGRQGSELEIQNSNEVTEIVEITPYRLESKYSDKRHPDEVRFTSNLEDDLKRRDFTINAMALMVKHQAPSTKLQTSTNHKILNSKESEKEITRYSLLVTDYELVDLFDGQKDLKNKVIQAVGKPDERFSEDALRILRAVRFATELNFTIENETKKAIKKNAHLLGKIAEERIKDEFVKIIMSDRASDGIRMMHELGILEHVIPELEKGIGVKQNKSHTFEVWEHLLRSLDHAVANKWPLEIRLATLLHDVGKPKSRRRDETKKDYTFYGHEVIGQRMSVKILSRLKFSKDITDKVSKYVRYHMFFSDIEKITLSAVRRIVSKVGREDVWDLLKVRFADRVGMGRPKEEPYRLRKYESMIEEVMRDPVSVGMLKIDGDKIMKLLDMKPGPKIGLILHALLEETLDDPAKNTKKYLEEKTEKLAKLSEKELEKIGKSGKLKKEKEEQREIDKIRKRWYVK
jgi:putative nucleotidyltransferase with HDIG domain